MRSAPPFSGRNCCRSRHARKSPICCAAMSRFDWIFMMPGMTQKLLREVRDKTERLQNQLWADGVAMGEKDPRAVTTGLFLQSLNETIDLNATRITALENHVPEITLVLLYFVAVMATGLIGYGCGLSGYEISS